MDDNTIRDLTLLLLYLTSWEEKQLDETALRSWKGYDFNVLNQLEDDDLIVGGKRAKSVYLSEDGIEKAKELMKKYNI